MNEWRNDFYFVGVFGFVWLVLESIQVCIQAIVDSELNQSTRILQEQLNRKENCQGCKILGFTYQ